MSQREQSPKPEALVQLYEALSSIMTPTHVAGKRSARTKRGRQRVLHAAQFLGNRNVVLYNENPQTGLLELRNGGGRRFTEELFRDVNP